MQQIALWLEYAFKKHFATRLHYDLRLLWNGVLLSWAVPLGPSLVAGEAREAIEMMDHDRKNLLFEGLHETGPIMLWDCGAWKPLPGYEDVGDCMRKGILGFTLAGEKLRGDWILKRQNNLETGFRSVWKLSKQPDSFARGVADASVLTEMPNSVITKRTFAEIEHDWISPKCADESQLNLF